jgi:hypothetical protein
MQQAFPETREAMTGRDGLMGATNQEQRQETYCEDEVDKCGGFHEPFFLGDIQFIRNKVISKINHIPFQLPLAGAPCQKSMNLAANGALGPPTEGVWVQIAAASLVALIWMTRGGGSCTPGGNFPHQMTINLFLYL